MTAAIEKLEETARAGANRQVVVLHLGNELYGVDIASIHTVLTPQPITPVPSVAPHILGVMNLRGRVVPVLDLRARFGMPPLDEACRKSVRTVIVEADGPASGGTASTPAVGLVVDSVSEVLWLSPDSIEPPSALLSDAEGRSLTGIARVPGDRLLLLLDIPQVLALTGE